MGYFVITTIIFIFVVLIWVVFALVKARQRIKLSKERPISKRLERAIEYLQKKSKITNEEYRKLNKVSDTTAVKDLDELERLGLVKQIGKKGRNVHYVLTKDYPPVIHN